MTSAIEDGSNGNGLIATTTPGSNDVLSHADDNFDVLSGKQQQQQPRTCGILFKLVVGTVILATLLDVRNWSKRVLDASTMAKVRIRTTATVEDDPSSHSSLTKDAVSDAIATLTAEQKEPSDSKLVVENFSIQSGPVLINNELKDNDQGDNECPLLSLFRDAGVRIDLLDPDEVDALPRVYRNMQQLYGDLSTPVMVGMDSCQAYRDRVPLEDRYSTVAGLYNSGTNAMWYHLKTNILSVPSQEDAPWNKHREAAARSQYAAKGPKQAKEVENVLPIVMIRDPFAWMQSLCKSSYNDVWDHTAAHCPNLVPTQDDIDRFGMVQNGYNVTDIYHTPSEHRNHWDNILHQYNDWYGQYLNADFPRLIVRFEDMLVQAPAVVQQIATCLGTTLKHRSPTTNTPVLLYKTKTAKWHGSQTDFVHAVLKTGDAEGRLFNLTQDDLEFSSKYLDPTIIRTFQYTLPSY